MRRLDDTSDNQLAGVGQDRMTPNAAMATPNVRSAIGFTLERILSAELQESWTFCLGGVGAVVMDPPPGLKTTYRFAVTFYHGGLVTTGIDS